MRLTRRFTLTELLVTIAIVAIVMGLGIGALRRAGTKDELVATQQAVRAILRRARNAAREERYGVTVEIDAERGLISAQQKSTITQFHLEQPALVVDTTPGFAWASEPRPIDKSTTLIHEGARGYQLVSEDAGAAGGKIGANLLFEKSDEKGAAWAWVEHRPALMPREGVHVRCWLYLGDLRSRLYKRRSQEQRNPGNRDYERAGEPWREAPPRLEEFDDHDPPYFVIARKGKAFGLAITANYELEVGLTGEGPSGEVTYLTRTRPHTLRPDRWYRVEFGFDGREVRIVVDGIGRLHLPLAGFEVLPETLLRDPSPLAFSDPDPRRAFYGMLDELKFATIVSGTRYEIPKDIVLIAPSREISFDLLGQLDPARHAEPFALYVCNAENFAELMDPKPADGTGGVKKEGTRTRSEQDAIEKQKAEVLIGPKRFERFVAIRKQLQEREYRRVMVDRTGLVSE